MKACQVEEKFCYLKNKLAYPNKRSKLIFLDFFFQKKKKVNFFSFNYDVKYMVCQ